VARLDLPVYGQEHLGGDHTFQTSRIVEIPSPTCIDRYTSACVYFTCTTSIANINLLILTASPSQNVDEEEEDVNGRRWEIKVNDKEETRRST
jgi:hypothetical protein